MSCLHEWTWLVGTRADTCKIDTIGKMPETTRLPNSMPALVPTEDAS